MAVLRPHHLWLALWLAATLPAGGPAVADEADPVLAKVAAMTAKGEIRAAEIALKKAIARQPDSGDLRLALARVHLQMGELGESEEDLRLAQERGIAAEIILPQLGSLWLAEGDAVRVEHDLVPTDAMTRGQRATVLALRATAELSLQKTDRAKASIDQALTYGGTEIPEVAVALAQWRLASDQPEAAAAVLDELLARDPNDLEALMLKALLLLRQHDVAGAMTFYDRGLAARPLAALPRLGRAVLLISSGRMDEARRDIEALHRSLPNNPQVVLLQAQMLTFDGKPDEAWERLRPVIPDLSHNLAAQILAGRLTLSRDQLAQAHDFAAVAVGLAPDNSDAVRLLAAVELREGEPGKAAALLERMLRQVPDDPYLLADLGEIYGVTGQAELAAQIFERAARKAPDDHNLQFSAAMAQIRSGNPAAALPSLMALGTADRRAGPALATIYLAQGRIAEARQQAEAFAKREGKNPLADSLLAQVALADGDVATAQRHFQAALAKRADFLPALQGLAACAQRLHNYDLAIAGFQATLARNAENEAAQLGLIAAVIASGDEPRAFDLAAAASKALPDSAALALAHIELLARRKRLDEALAATAELQARFPRQPDILAMLARLQESSGRSSDAVASLRVMAQRAPGAGDLLLAELLQRLGRADEARADLDIAVTKAPGLYALWQMRLADEVRRRGLAAALELARAAHAYSPAMADLLTADLLAGAGRHDEAVRHYRAAYDAAGETTGRPILQRLVRGLVRTGRRDEAVRLLAAWLDRHGNDVAVRLALADQLLAQRNWSEARRQYEQLLRVDPNNPTALNNLALCLAEQNEGPQAVAVARQALSHSADAPAVADTLGWLLLGQDQVAEAVTLLSRANDRLKGADPSVAYHLATAYARAGDSQKAMSLLSRLSRSSPFPEQKAAAGLAAELTRGKPPSP